MQARTSTTAKAMTMMDMTGFYILIGIGLLISGLIGVLKIGLWMWFATHLLGRPPTQPRPGDYHQHAPAPPSRKSTASTIKTWASIVATVLGIISTSAGLLGKCTPDTPSVGSRCCTSMGSCGMAQLGPVGADCFCMDVFGNSSAGRVCE